MSTLRIDQEGWNSGYLMTGETYLWAQMFTTLETAFAVDKIQLLGSRSAGWTGVIHIGIRAASGGRPTGSDLCSVEIAIETLWPYNAYNPTLSTDMAFTSRASLAANTQYAAVWYETSGNNFYVCGGGSYNQGNPAGSLTRSFNGGASWQDLWSGSTAIKVWGDPAATGWANIAKVNGITSSGLAKVNGIAVASIAKINGVAV
ncbi:MAG: hypothetical protein ABSG90_12220 [Dehalococcoidia bacterium]|jgi:hypothetical protein